MLVRRPRCHQTPSAGRAPVPLHRVGLMVVNPLYYHSPAAAHPSPPHDAARRASGAIGSVFTKCPEQALKASNICIFPHAGRTACIALGHISALEIRWHCPACKSCAVIIARTHPSQRSCSCITLLLSCRWGGVPSFGLAMPQKPYAGVHAQYPKIRDDFGALENPPI